MSKLKLITYNVHRGKKLPRILEWLEQQDADVICLQEVPLYRLDELKGFLNKNGYEMSIGNVEEYAKRRAFTVATIYKEHNLPLLSSHNLKLPKNYFDRIFWPGSMIQRVLLLEFKLGDQKLIVANVHLSALTVNYWSRFYIHEFLKLADHREQLPDIVCGDFNYSSLFPGTKIDDAFADYYYKNVLLRPIPTQKIYGLIRHQLDYMFYREPLLRLDDIQVGSDVKLSDHFPMISEFTIHT